MSKCAQRCTWADPGDPWKQEHWPLGRATRCGSLWPHNQSLIRISHIQNASITSCRKINSRFPPQDGPRRGFYRTPHLKLSTVNWDMVDYDQNAFSSMEMDKSLGFPIPEFSGCATSTTSSTVSSCNKRSWISGRKPVHLIKLPAVTLHSGR